MFSKILHRSILVLTVAIISVQPVFAQEGGSGKPSRLLDFNQNDIYNYRPVPFGGGCTAGGVQDLAGHKLPATKGGTGFEEEINARGQVKGKWGTNEGFVTFKENVQNASTTPIGNLPGAPTMQQLYMDYYITMRWRYVTWNWNGSSSSPGPESLAFYRGGDGSPEERAANAPRVLVRNPETNKSIIAVVLEAGPAPWTGVDFANNNDPKQGWTNPQDGTPETYRGRVSGFPPKAIEALGATQRMQDGSGPDLEYSWAPNQKAVPGPVGDGTEQDASCGGGTVTIDGLPYAWPVEPQVKRYFTNAPCNNSSGCHHDGTAAYDLYFPPQGSMNGADVYAIVDGRIMNVQIPYLLPEARGVSGPHPECRAVQFEADPKYSSTRHSQGEGNKKFWYGHVKNVTEKRENIKAGEKIAEVADLEFGWQCVGGRDHLHIDQGCKRDGVRWSTGGNLGCRDTGFVALMEEIRNLLPSPAPGDE